MENKVSKKKGGKGWVRKIVRLVFFVAFVFILSGASLVVIDRYLFPYLATVKWAGKYNFFKKATEDVVVVNKTEQVTVSEDQTISSYSNESASSVVEILSSKEGNKNPGKMGDTSFVKYGSGLVITADGLILTYKDAVMDGQVKYRVFTQKDKSFDARLVAVDNFTNLALLKIDGVENLPVASFIAPEDMKTGMKAVAIGRSGNNFQLIFKSGLVSQYDSGFSLAGALPLSEKLQGVYVADFDMSEEGDERVVGGAVANYGGNVIGILGVRKISDQKQYFIIPSDRLQELVNQYISTGSVKRGALGVYYMPLTSESAALFGSSDRGALVYSPSGQQGLAVISGSAAEKAGMKIQDVIASVNGEEVNSENNLARLVSKYKPGEMVELKIIRDGKEVAIPVVLE
ncbi:MAG: PDZ domain-containing protein [Candidatus Moranbacteria bacterium]|nr:PDZ domain-containing protein [Candidatus Moranbacteria bacterium]